jgi:hypothetical protein
MRLLVPVLAACLAALPLARPAAAADPAPAPAAMPAADRAAIAEVISRQLDAFRRDDAGGAFAFASPGIRAMTGSPERFMEMVRAGYAPVYRSREARFLDLSRVEGRLVQRVLLTGADGSLAAALYYMEAQPDGSWRIAGCELVEGSDA